ncbi:hypothetical protein AB0M43_14700 [Longispora sp. NPDC051575]|uniref:hypothetical protein n=1 Tax=Longispora sp. NPDC051575 TaxID=3154943 RepID=UPI0034271C05
MSNLAARVLTVVLLPALAACGTNDPAPKPTTTTTASTAAKSPVNDIGTASKAAEDAYRNMWKAFISASRASNPNDPELARYASGHALDVLMRGLQQSKDQGLLGRGEVILRPSVSGLEPATAPTKAAVEDCVDTSGTAMYKADGSPYQDSLGGKRSMSASLELIDGSWKVVNFGLKAVGTCA